MADKTPLVLVHTDAAATWATSPDRATVFVIRTPAPEMSDGDAAEPVDTVYTMPAKPNAGLALLYLRMARTQNPDVAMSWLIETAVGEAGYLALAEDLSGIENGAEAQRILQGITQQIQTVAMGGLDPKA